MRDKRKQLKIENKLTVNSNPELNSKLNFVTSRIVSMLPLPHLSALCQNWVGGYFSVPIGDGKQIEQNRKQTFNFL